MKLVKIVAHHKNPTRASELYLKEGVIAVGYVYDKSVAKGDVETIREYFRKDREKTEQQVGQGTSAFLKFRDEIEESNIVFAYLGGNKIGLVGEVVGPSRYNDKNSVGDNKGEIGYPNQRKVKWWDTPRNFDRHFLPTTLSEWVGRIGTIAIQEFDKEKLYKLLRKIPSQTAVDKALEIHDENKIKDNMEKNIGEVEKGLKLVEREHPTSDGPMDFLAKDSNGNNVVIEVKTKADDSTVSQLRRYMRSLKRDTKDSKVRGIIVAEEFTKRCLDDVAELKEHGIDIGLYKCRKKFDFTKV